MISASPIFMKEFDVFLAYKVFHQVKIAYQIEPSFLAFVASTILNIMMLIDKLIVEEKLTKKFLPIKKRFNNNILDNSDQSQHEPLDFSLPTRKRASLKKPNEGEISPKSSKSCDQDRKNGSQIAAIKAIDRVQNQLGFLNLANWLLANELLPFYRLAPKFAQSSPSTTPDSSSDERNSATNNQNNHQEFVINPVTGNKVRKSYKNMTLERRMEANARERTRVHTIGAAFDDLRKLIPTKQPDQKLSKLSILRIACSYILLLAAMNGLDYSAGSQGYSVEECLELVSETLAAESKYRK
uniref:BHLH domain-containing protein n=1 Tax=Romanomermis culicivorax TaxID=13658 RepID=A0A915J1L0_ROMCU